MSVPFVDLRAAYAGIEAEIEPLLHDLMARGAFILGRELVEFESAFAGYCETEACAGLENGTTALSLALKVLGIGSGDEVVVPANTFAVLWIDGLTLAEFAIAQSSAIGAIALLFIAFLEISLWRGWIRNNKNLARIRPATSGEAGEP
ncbi:MAG: DegT/DnrJ/EryC1/StrS family aminotransferase [Alphaproteobacteria bacterium]|nr:DegT/DnrJ/EryC1/StrS family aminotransferase [Alphaproteobacteria bacterium]